MVMKMTCIHFHMQGGMKMNCNCNAYPFPHRPLGGACDGEAIWNEVAQEGWECAECPLCEHTRERSEFHGAIAWHSYRECGAKSAEQCPGVAERIGREAAA